MTADPALKWAIDKAEEAHRKTVYPPGAEMYFHEAEGYLTDLRSRGALEEARSKVIEAARELNIKMPDAGDGDPLSDLDDAIQELEAVERR